MFRKGIALLLAATLLVSFVVPHVYAEQEIIYLSVNDAIVPVEDKTMPLERAGMIFVPYRIFTDNFDISGTYDSEEQILKLSSGEKMMTFDILGSETFDENGEFYTYPAFSYNGTIYVCSYDVANKMGLYYSVIDETFSSKERTVVRINEQQPRFGDNVYVYLIQKKLDEALEKYNESKNAGQTGESNQTGSTEETQPPEPIPPEIIQPEKKTDIFITFSNAPGEGTEQILKELQKYNYTATFFITGGRAKENDKILRKICGNGHSVGIGEYTSKRNFYSSAEEMISELEKTNNLLFKICGLKTMLVRTPGGSKNNLNSDMKGALTDNGYRLWDWTVSVVGYQKADTIYSTATELLEKSEGTVVLEMDCTEQSAEALPRILKYLRANKYRPKLIDECETPVNFYRLK